MAFRLIHVSLHAPPTTVLYTLPTRRSSDLDTLRIGDDDRLLALARLGVVVQPMLGQIHDQAGPRTGLVVNLPEHRLYYYPQPRKGEQPVVITYPESIEIGRASCRESVEHRGRRSMKRNMDKPKSHARYL